MKRKYFVVFKCGSKYTDNYAEVWAENADEAFNVALEIYGNTDVAKIVIGENVFNRVKKIYSLTPINEIRA